MADYYHNHHNVPARVRTRAHSDHTGAVLAGLALLMLAVLALLWFGRGAVVSALPQPTTAPASVMSAPIVVAPARSLIAPPRAVPPPSDVVVAAGDTRPVQP